MENDHDMNMECTNVPLPTSRSSTPDLFTPCEQLIQVQNDIKKFTLLSIGAQQSLSSMAPFMTADDLEVTELFQRLKFYQEELKRSECEYGTLPPCTTSGCTVHGTPPSSPSKSLKDYPALPKINSNKRKESDDGFIPGLYHGFIPGWIYTRRQTIKKPNLITNNTFSMETGNAFDNLKEKDISGTSTSQATTHNDNTPSNTNQVKKFLPTPVMLYCTDTIRNTKKTINSTFPHLRSKLSVLASLGLPLPSKVQGSLLVCVTSVGIMVQFRMSALQSCSQSQWESCGVKDHEKGNDNGCVQSMIVAWSVESSMS
ncbi:hypothetical protein TNIN_133041 [Trichonephila inaurata madagascariensis]|uniref:Uncharacterized protein n=1 Tax=Trichonephila inaurata madagascariensis TaxID=2747483 RepID=A0A8X6IHE8_9ARAC|nr:hypothetical protein TNIN_133041 [Trichonephila inaurata madagascariensis]